MEKPRNIHGIDHIAIVVPNTEAALAVWRDGFGLAVKHSEIVSDGAIRLTHLDGGGTDLQLVEPLKADHPLQAWLKEHGSGLHHLCFAAEEEKPVIESLRREGFVPAQQEPHQGIMGKWALFLDQSSTGNVRVELTGR